MADLCSNLETIKASLEVLLAFTDEALSASADNTTTNEQTKETDEQVNARELIALCRVCGQPENAAQMISRKLSLADAKAELKAGLSGRTNGASPTAFWAKHNKGGK